MVYSLFILTFALLQELRETLNRLVTSACETFVSAPLKEGGDQETSPLRGGTPSSLSPSSSRPGSSMLDNGSRDSWDMDRHANDLAQIVDTVSHHARVIASHAHQRNSVPQGHTHSRSHGNLVELQEVDEDELRRKDHLKYPSDYAVDSTYYQLLQDKNQAYRALRTLAHAGKEVKTRGCVVREEDRVANDLESSLSEPDLHRGMHMCTRCVTLMSLQTGTHVCMYYIHYLLCS